MLKALGARHTAFRGFGFRPEHWALFADAMEMGVIAYARHNSEEKELESIEVFKVYFVIRLKIPLNSLLFQN